MDKKRSSKVVYVIGRLPPPHGGVSAFVSRRVNHLLVQGFDVEVITPSPFRLVLGLLAAKWRQAFRIEMNTIRLPVLAVVALTGNLRKVVVYDHNHSRHFQELAGPSRALMSYFVARIHCLRLVSDHLRMNYVVNNIRLPRAVEIASPFLPPPLETVETVKHAYPPDLRQFVATRRPLLLTSVWRFSSLSESDIYRVDLCLELVERLREKYANIGLIVGIGDAKFKDGLQVFERAVEGKRLGNSVFPATGGVELWPLMTEADVFIRPTQTDGSSVSVLEALYCRCPVVASDAVPRPDGVILFQSNNLASLEATVVGLLGDPTKWPKRIVSQ